MILGEENIRFQLIWKLFHNGAFGKGSLYEETLLGGIPKHLIRKAREELNNLIKEGLICQKPKKYGLKYYLDFNEETKKIIDIIKNQRF